jgi:hypothetical protein
MDRFRALMWAGAVSLVWYRKRLQLELLEHRGVGFIGQAPEVL